MDIFFQVKTTLWTLDSWFLLQTFFKRKFKSASEDFATLSFVFCVCFLKPALQISSRASPSSCWFASSSLLSALGSWTIFTSISHLHFLCWLSLEALWPTAAQCIKRITLCFSLREGGTGTVPLPRWERCLMLHREGSGDPRDPGRLRSSCLCPTITSWQAAAALILQRLFSLTVAILQHFWAPKQPKAEDCSERNQVLTETVSTFFSPGGTEENEKKTLAIPVLLAHCWFYSWQEPGEKILHYTKRNYNWVLCRRQFVCKQEKMRLFYRILKVQHTPTNDHLSLRKTLLWHQGKGSAWFWCSCPVREQRPLAVSHGQFPWVTTSLLELIVQACNSQTPTFP